MLPTSAGVEPATSWSPVGRRIQLSHRGWQRLSEVLHGFIDRIFSENVVTRITEGTLVELFGYNYEQQDLIIDQLNRLFLLIRYSIGACRVMVELMLGLS